MNDFPTYSRHAREAIDLFVADQVVAVFYFEDAAHEAVYERLLRRLFPRIKPFHVVCLCGKQEVISKARARRSGARFNIFVVDKDFDDLLHRIQVIEDLFYLDRYCLENYFIDDGALLETAVEVQPALTRMAAEHSTRDRQAFFAELRRRYVEITRMFVVAQLFSISIETTKMPGRELLSGAPPGEPLPANDWIQEYRRKLLARANREQEFLTEEELDRQLGDALPAPEDPHLCGKHLLYCMVQYFKARLDVDLFSLSRLTFFLRLLTHIDMETFADFRSRVLEKYPELIHSS